MQKQHNHAVLSITFAFPFERQSSEINYNHLVFQTPSEYDLAHERPVTMTIWDDAVKSVGGQSPGLPQPGDLSANLTSMLASFASAFEQTTRLLKLNFAAGSGIPANLLLPHRLTGHEAINGHFS